MLATRFERPPGDVGNAASFTVPVLKETLRDATPARVVRGDASALLPDFVAAGRRLVARGATLVSTSCGFLAPFQTALAEALPVPVYASALLHCARCTRPAILTIEAAALVPARLAACGVAPDTPVAGMDGTGFAAAIMGDAPLDLGTARAEHVERALALVAAHPETSDIVLECTNMGPYAHAIGRATGRPVHSIVPLLEAELAPSHPASQRD